MRVTDINGSTHQRMEPYEQLSARTGLESYAAIPRSDRTAGTHQRRGLCVAPTTEPASALQETVPCE